MKLKIHNFKEPNELNLKGTVWIGKIKLIRPGVYTADVTAVEEDACEFDDDDYLIEMCRGWFGKENIELCG